MPLLSDEEKTLLEYSLSPRIIADAEMVALQIRDQWHAGWSDLEMRQMKYFNQSAIEKERLRTHTKEYPWARQVPLTPLLQLPENLPLEIALEQRTSDRRLQGDACSFRDLSSLLYFSNHIHPDGIKRTVPSGGQRYPLETYVYAHNVEGLSQGLYHYNLPKQCLEELPKSPDFIANVFGKVDEDLSQASFFTFTTALTARSSVKYGHLSFRLILLEAGHLSQSQWLVATSLRLKSWPLAKIQDQNFHSALNINSHQEFFTFCQVFGR